MIEDNLNIRQAVAQFLEKASGVGNVVYMRKGVATPLYFMEAADSNVVTDFEPDDNLSFYISVQPGGYTPVRSLRRDWQLATVRIVVKDKTTGLALDGAQILNLFFMKEQNRTFRVGNVNVKDILVLDACEIFHREPGKKSKAQFRIQLKYVITTQLY